MHASAENVLYPGFSKNTIPHVEVKNESGTSNSPLNDPERFQSMAFATCVVALRLGSSACIIIVPPDCWRECRASRSDRISVAGRHCVPGFRSESCARGLALVRRRNMVSPKPTCDRSLHRSSVNSPPSALIGTPSANSVPGRASGVEDRLPPVSFLLPVASPERVGRVVQSLGDGNAF